MTTDDLRMKYGKQVSFNCKDGDEAFTDGYTLWLESQVLLFDQPCKTFLSDGTTTSNTKCQFCGNEKWEH